MFQKIKVNAMKHSAGTSLLWQANDVGHCHSSLHKFVNEQKFKNQLSQGDVAEVQAHIDLTLEGLKKKELPLLEKKLSIKL
jgi:hypothetical protein